MTPTQFSFDAIGTQWTIDIITPLSASERNEILKKIKSRIEIYDKVYSRFRDDSLITAIAQKKGEYIFPEDARNLFSVYRKMYEVTEGFVTPLIGKTLSAAGYDSQYSFRSKTLQKPPHWEKILTYSHPELKTKKPVLLDFGAAGKGYLVDIIGELLKEQNIHDFCIDAGGDILYNSTENQPLRVGLEHPSNPKQVIGTIDITNQSICGSAGNRRSWGKFHHIIDPYKLSSPKNILATWAVADNTILADGMTTCLFFTKGKKLQKYFDFEYFIVFQDYSYEMSSNFPADVYTSVGTVTR